MIFFWPVLYDGFKTYCVIKSRRDRIPCLMDAMAFRGHRNSRRQQQQIVVTADSKAELFTIIGGA